MSLALVSLRQESPFVAQFGFKLVTLVLAFQVLEFQASIAMLS